MPGAVGYLPGAGHYSGGILIYAGNGFRYGPHLVLLPGRHVPDFPGALENAAGVIPGLLSRH